jgi:hypothetical protein
VLAFGITRYVPVRCHEAEERRLGYKYNYCLFLNTKVHVQWLAPNFWSRGVWVRVLALYYFLQVLSVDRVKPNKIGTRPIFTTDNGVLCSDNV